MIGKVRSIETNFIWFDFNQGIKKGDFLEISDRKFLFSVTQIKKDYAQAIILEPASLSSIRLGDEVRVSKMAQVFSPGIFGKTLDGYQRDLAFSPPFCEPGSMEDKEVPLGMAFSPVTNPIPFEWILSEGKEVLEGDPVAFWEESGFKFYIYSPSSGTLKIQVPSGSQIPGSLLGHVAGQPILFQADLSYGVQNLSRDPSINQKTTGLRIIDSFFPIVEGGRTVFPGGFGTGKTNLTKFLVKYSEGIVILVACGERGNEISSFQEIMDNNPELRARTILLACTSDMPPLMRSTLLSTASRLANYFANLGISSTIYLDSLSRWAESMRELVGFEKSLSGEQGYHSSTFTFLSNLFSSAGNYQVQGKVVSISIFSVISPPGGDFTEPISTMCSSLADSVLFLSTNLREKRHFPTVDWRISFSKNFVFLKNRQDTSPELVSHYGNLEFISRKVDDYHQVKELADILGVQRLKKTQLLNLYFGEAIINFFFKQMFLSPDDGFMSLESQMKFAQFLKEVYSYHAQKTSFNEKEGNKMFENLSQLNLGLDNPFTPYLREMELNFQDVSN